VYFSQGAESLRGMINKALQVVPSNLHQTTPITLKATAGLRLLSDKKAEDLLQEVQNVKLILIHSIYVREKVIWVHVRTIFICS